MRCSGQEAVVQRHDAIDVDNHGDAAPAGLGAQIGRERRAAAFDQDGVAIGQQPAGIGQAHLPQLRIAEFHVGAFAAAINQDRGDRR